MSKTRNLLTALGVGIVALGIGYLTTATGNLGTTGTGTTPRLVNVLTGSTQFTGEQKEESAISVKVLKPSSDSIILLEDEVNKPSVDYVINKLEQAREKGTKHVYLVIDSPGGSVLDGAKLISYIKSSSVTIDTVCETLCASMAFHIFQAGNQRLMLDKSVLMAHPASGGAQGTIENMKSMIDTIKIYVDRMDADAAKRSGIPFDKFKKLVADNIWAEARDAVAMHLADGVVSLQYTSPTSNSSSFVGNQVDADKNTNINLFRTLHN